MRTKLAVALFAVALSLVAAPVLAGDVETNPFAFVRGWIVGLFA